MRARRTLIPYDPKNTSKQRKGLNTNVEDKYNCEKMLITLKEKTVTAHKKKQGKRDEQTEEDERRQDNYTVKTTRRTKRHNTLTRTRQGQSFENKTNEIRNEQEKTSTALKGIYNTDKYIKRMNMN